MVEQTEKPRISHIALKVTDLDATAGFYKDVFGFTEIARHHDGDHVSLHLTDGYLDLALVKYKSEESVIGQIAGTETCIHHFGIDVPDVDGYKKTLESWGADVFNGDGGHGWNPSNAGAGPHWIQIYIGTTPRALASYAIEGTGQPQRRRRRKQ